MTDKELEEKLSQISMDRLFSLYIYDDSEEIEDVFYECSSLFFSKTFYLKHKDVINSFVKKVCSYSREGMFLNSIKLASPYFMSRDILESIRDNPTLEEVDFGDCELSKEAFDILKENSSLSHIGSSSVCSELEHCYDNRLGAVVNREIHRFLTVRDLLYSDNVKIYGDLTEDELEDICQLLSKRKIHGTIDFIGTECGSSIKKIIDTIDEHEKDNLERTQYRIHISNRSSFSYDAFVDPQQNSKIQVITTTDEVTDMNVYIKVENEMKKLFGIYEVYRDKLSPFEQVIFLHHLVSSFRKYKEESNDEDWRNSRLLHKLLFSDQIVCAGFSFLLSDLGNRFDLPISEVFTNANHYTNGNYNHMNNIVFLDDDKYDIHGVYLLDATGDNSPSDIFIFNYCLLTADEYRNHPLDLYTSGFSLIGVDDFEMFSKRIKEHSEDAQFLLSILNKYYPDYPLFQYNVQDDDFQSLYLGHLEDLFQMSRDMKITPISDEQFSEAITNLEKVLHPELNDSQVQEKVQYTMDLYHQRNQEIYGDSSRIPRVKQKRL